MTAPFPQRRLLSRSDPDPVEWVNPDSTAAVLLVCEHAGQAIPAALGDLGLPAGAIDDHIGWDIGAMGVARRVSEMLGAPLIAQRYSRLVIDCNRPPRSIYAIPEASDGVVIPGNVGITGEQHIARVQEIFDPYSDAVETGFRKSERRMAISIHSYTPSMRGKPPRPWHAGFLARQDVDTSRRFLDHLARAEPGLVAALNEPYQVDDETDWFIPVQCEPRGVRHSLVEIRNDLIRAEEGQERWATFLGEAIRGILEADGLA